MRKRRKSKRTKSFVQVIDVDDNWTEEQIYRQDRSTVRSRKPRPPKSFAQAIMGDKWTDPQIFESLCEVMLTELVGRQFRRAKAGFQGGRDIDAEPGGIVTHVECKRYSRKLRAREIQGEFAQALNLDKRLELYVLCSSVPVDAQLASQMREQAAPHLVHVLFLDGAKTLSPLVLCFAATLQWRERAWWSGVPVITNELAQTLEKPGAEEMLSRIKKALAGVDAGLAAVRDKISLELRRAFTSDAVSRDLFGQPLSVLQDTSSTIRRVKLEECLLAWLSSWKSNNGPALIMGNEGVGKTWALAAWIADNLQKLPPVLFVTRRDTVTANLIKVLASALSRWAAGPTEEVWERWITKRINDDSANPFLLVVFDGVNERPDAPWQELLQEAVGKHRIQVILTSRPRFAEFHLGYDASNSSPANESWYINSPVNGIRVEEFDDEELDAAVNRAGLKRTMFSSSVRNFLRVPRYFRVALENVRSVQDSGDITVERLLFFDFRNRVSLGRFHLVREMPDQKWHEALRKLVGVKYEDVTTTSEPTQAVIHEADIERLIGGETRLGHDAVERCLSEIVEGRLFEKVGRGRYKVNPTLAKYALGAVLLEEVTDKIEIGWAAAEQRLAEFCEPLAGLDFLASIVRAATAIAILSKERCSESVKALLLATWADIQNADFPSVFAAYARSAPHTYLDVAELLEQRDALRGQGGDFIFQAILRLREVPELQPTLADRFARWIGWDESASMFSHLHAALNLPLPSAKIRTDRGLRKLTLAVVARGVQLPWLNIIVCSCLLAAARNTANGLLDLAWIVRLNQYDAIPVKLEIRRIAQVLRQHQGVFSRCAAALLMATVGGSEEEADLNAQLRDEARALGAKDGTDLIGKIAGFRIQADVFDSLNPDSKPAAAAQDPPEAGLSFDQIVKQARVKPALIAKIYGRTKALVQRYLQAGTKNLAPQKDGDCSNVPPILLAPFLRQSDISSIELLLTDAFARLGLFGLNYGEASELKPLVETVFKLSSVEKRAQLRSQWSQFRVGELAVSEAWRRFSTVHEKSTESPRDTIVDSLKLSNDCRLPALQVADDPTVASLLGNRSVSPQNLMDLLLRDDLEPAIRGLVLATVCEDAAPGRGLDLMNAGWSWSASISDEERAYGGLLLMRDTAVTVEKIIEVLPPIFWGGAVANRGWHDNDLALLETTLYPYLEPGHPAPLDRAASRTLWIMFTRSGQTCSNDLVRGYIQFFLRLAEHSRKRWISKFEREPLAQRNEIARLLHLSLIHALLQLDVQTAEGLWHSFFESRQHKFEPMRSLHHMWHNLTISVPSEQCVWLESALSYYDSDLSLFELAITCHAEKGVAWLSAVIERDQASPIDWRRARAMTLTGFSDVIQFEISNFRDCGGWSGTSLEQASRWRCRDKFARYWYSKYLPEPGTVRAVSDLSLYLASVDPRAKLWRTDAERGSNASRLEHVQLFAEAVREFEQANIACLKNSYLGWPLAGRSLPFGMQAA